LDGIWLLIHCSTGLWLVIKILGRCLCLRDILLNIKVLCVSSWNIIDATTITHGLARVISSSIIFNLLVLLLLTVVVLYNFIGVIVVAILLKLWLVVRGCGFEIIVLRWWTKTVSFGFVFLSIFYLLTILIWDLLLPLSRFRLVIIESLRSLLGVQAILRTLHHTALSMFFKRSTLIVLLREN